MTVKLLRGDTLQFGTYGFEHLNLPADRPKYWDTIQVARIADSKTFSEVRFGVTLEKSPPGPQIKHTFDYDEVSYIVSGGPLRIIHEGQILEGRAGDFFIFPKGSKILGQAVNDFVYLTCHFPPLDLIIKERENKYGLKK